MVRKTEQIFFTQNQNLKFNLNSILPLKVSETVQWASRHGEISAPVLWLPCCRSWSCCGLITLGECVHLSPTCHCWDYTPQACGSTAPALLIQSLIKISCKSFRQMQSQASIGPINTQWEWAKLQCWWRKLLRWDEMWSLCTIGIKLIGYSPIRETKAP